MDFKNRKSFEENRLSLNNEIFDEISVFTDAESKLTYTKRNLGNGDYFHYFVLQNSKNYKFDFQIDILNRIGFEEYYIKPEYNNRYGYNKSTGPSSLLFSNTTSFLISKIYYYKKLSLNYENGNKSSLLELISEEDSIVYNDKVMEVNIKENVHESSFFVLESKVKLFQDENRLKEYFIYYFENVKNNCVENSFFMLPSGLMSKLPYSIEPFTKDGYGYSLHHSSKRELIYFAKKNRDRFYYDMLMNSYMQLKLYANEINGVYISNITSTWLKKDFEISAPYIDTRLNEYLNLTISEFGEIYNLDFIKSNRIEFLDFLVERSKYNLYKSKNGYFYPDYFSISDLNLITHASLNHQLAILNLAFIQFEIDREKKYNILIKNMLNFLRDTHMSWINQEQEDLYYSCVIKDNKLKMKDKDYVFVTLYDLLVLYENCLKNKFTNIEFLRRLIDIKLKNAEKAKCSSNEKTEFGVKIYKKLNSLSYFKEENKMFDVKNYWDERYKSNRNSGSGSYGRLSQFKAEVINNFVKENKINEILEFGCGDGNNLQFYNVENYHGVDISIEAIKICRAKYTGVEGKNFYTYDELYDLKRSFECTMSLDVIYHLSDDVIYYKYLDELFGLSSKYVIIYSNSTNYHFAGVDTTAGYVLFRDFLKDVEKLYKNYTLIELIPNEFPYSVTLPDDTSFADFYIFEKNTEREIDVSTMYANFYAKKQLNKQNVMAETLHDMNRNKGDFDKITDEKNSYISKYNYEQKELDKAKERIKELEEKSKSLEERLIFLEEKAEEAKKKTNEVEEKTKELDKKNQHLIIERDSYISKFLYEQKVLEETKRELNLIKSTKYYKLMRRNWSINSKVKFKLIRVKNGTATSLYGTFKNNRSIMGIFKKINNKFRIIKDPAVLNKNYVEKVRNVSDNVTYQNYLIKQNTVKNIADIKVAIILDEFSYMSFRDEFNCIVIKPDNWKEVIEREKPDLFFCESAWSGVDSKERYWKGKIYASQNFRTENRTILIDIINYCNLKNIPTIFWNKEDPTHYTDRVHDFVKTALMFDYIFTTAEECVEMYKRDYGHKNVFVLPFATNPKMFNPIETSIRTKDVIFAGSWYKQHPTRCEEMEYIFDKILQSGLNLKIYDRHSEVDDENHEFPEKYKQYINKAVAFENMPKVYKESEMSLNINTVVTSKTMFARRIFEVSSSNTLVLSNDFAGKVMFDENIIIIDKDMDFSKIDEYREKNLYNVLEKHTYAKRFRQILDNIGYNYEDKVAKLSVIFEINSDEDIDNFMKLNLDRQFEHSLLISKNIEPNKIKDYYEKYSNQINIISEHYLQNYEKNITLAEEYFVILKSFNKYKNLKKALLHFTYLEENCGVALTNINEKFVYYEKECKYDCVLAEKYFKEIILNDKVNLKVIEF
jgi:hypothetical protein